VDSEVSGQGELLASVVICTYNPNRQSLGRAIDALRVQSEPVRNWELIVVDNNSKPAIAGTLDLSWHPRASIVLEPQPGLTHARMKGIAEARSSLIIFVDDDNLLAPSYISDAIRISEQHGFLGAWGGGCRGEFETPPPPWLEPYLSFIAVKECRTTVWSNEYFHEAATPIGAGMCVRKAVADRYVAMVGENSVRRLLDRRGNELAGCGDYDMAMTAIDVGLGVGRFPELQLVHLIPRARMTEPYILKLAEESQASSFVLRAIRGRPHPALMAGSPLKQMLLWLRLWTLPPIDRRIRFALMRGYKKGQATAARLNAPSGGFETKI
jgi:glycosyltransferase involved in cell wall biosynthesis